MFKNIIEKCKNVVFRESNLFCSNSCY